MALNHAVVRTDRLAGTDVRNMLVSAQYIVVDSSGTSPVDVETAIDNGCVLKLDGLMTGEREVYRGVTPAADTPIEEVALVATPEVMYDERLRDLDDYYNEAGKIVRAYRFHSGDIFSVTKEALDGVDSPAVGNVVELKAGIKLNVAASATGGSTQIGEIIAIDVVGRYTYYVIQVA